MSQVDSLNVIGDVHGKIDQYRDTLLRMRGPSVQLGDMGFKNSYEALKLVAVPSWHRFIPGNHDDYKNLPAHAYKDAFGLESLGRIEFFYVRGSYSIDKADRIMGIDWWPEEEMSVPETGACFDSYMEHKPRIVLSHDGPTIATKYLVMYNIPNRTGMLLDHLYKHYQPDLWIFGHHHQSMDMMVDHTRFICLAELEALTIERHDNTYMIKR